MGYDLSVYAYDLNEDVANRWAKRLNQCDRTRYKFHPSVVFRVGSSGFWPIKVITPRRGLFSARQKFMSGFEMYVRNFDFESDFLLKDGEAETQRAELRAEGMDLELWEGFKSQISISFKPGNRFEAQLSFLSAAILTEELGGLCSDPQIGENLDQDHVFAWATERVRQHDFNTQGQNLIAHPFEGWK